MCKSRAALIPFIDIILCRTRRTGSRPPEAYFVYGEGRG